MPAKRKPKKKAAKQIKLEIVEKAWEEQTKEEKDNTIKTIVGALGKEELKNVDVVVARETQYPEGFTVESLAAVGSCTESQGKSISKYANLLDVFDKFEVEVSSVVIGCKLPYLVSAFTSDIKESSLLEDRRGKILFIQFWVHDNKRCEESMQALVALGEKHKEDWAGKVQLMSMCCEEDKDKWLAEIKKLGSAGVEHLWVGQGADEDADNLINKYEIESLPECMIVDGEGKLLQRADPEDLNIEEALSKYLAGETDIQLNPPVPEGAWQLQKPEKRAELITKVTTMLKGDPNLADVLLVTTEAEIHSTNPATPMRTELNAMLVGKVDIRAEAEVHKVMDVLQKEGGVKDIEMTVVVTSPETPITPTVLCSECNKAFSEMGAAARWHCAMCIVPYTCCDACKPARKHTSYHPLFRLGPGVTKEDMLAAPFTIGHFAVSMHDDEKKDGEAIPENQKRQVIHDGVYCNGCKEGPIALGDRWKCCCCADFDFCNDCYTEYLLHSEEKALPADHKVKEVKDGAEGSKHAKNHFFLCITDSDGIQMADDENEGDEGDFGAEELDDDDIKLLTAAMKNDDELDLDDTEGILAKIRELRATGQLDEEDEEEDGAEHKLNKMAEDATQVPLPDDDF